MIGTVNVKNPNKMLLCRVFRNSFMSSSKPAINMMYNKPIVENRSTAEFFSNKFKPCGPIITPEMINPIIPGILIRLSRIGESKIIKRISAKMSTGLLNGVSKAWLS